MRKIVLPILWATLMVCAGSAPEKKPNFLFLVVDDLRPELGTYGKSHIISPHIDRLASEGLQFDRAYCQVPVCGASRASLMTGMRPLADRFVDFKTYAEIDAPGAVTLPGFLKKNGYQTLSLGKVFHHADDMEQSWSRPAWRPSGGNYMDEVLPEHVRNGLKGPLWQRSSKPEGEFRDAKLADRTIEELHTLKSSGQPFFMAAGFEKPHMPFVAPARYFDMYNRGAIAVAGNPYRPHDSPRSLFSSGEHNTYHFLGLDPKSPEFHKAARHGYYACVSFVDAQIGRILRSLDSLGLRENTVVMLWGDHGWHLGEHGFWSKHNVLENATRTPLIISAPGFAIKEKSQALVEFVDLFPTVVEMAGLEPDAKLKAQLQGTSLLPLLRKPGLPWKKAAFTRWQEGESVITERYSYTEFSVNGTIERLLFDRQVDPEENQNVAGRDSYKAVVATMGKILADGWQEAKPPISVGMHGRRVGKAEASQAAFWRMPGFQGRGPWGWEAGWRDPSAGNDRTWTMVNALGRLRTLESRRK